METIKLLIEADPRCALIVHKIQYAFVLDQIVKRGSYTRLKLDLVHIQQTYVSTLHAKELEIINLQMQNRILFSGAIDILTEYRTRVAEVPALKMQLRRIMENVDLIKLGIPENVYISICNDLRQVWTGVDIQV